jgi:hypothetical protein
MTVNEIRIARLERAVHYAASFIETARLAIERFEKDKADRNVVDGTREHATAKRRSMDLTNALIDVRRTRYR